MRVILLIFILCFCFSCTRKSISEREEAMRVVSEPPELSDDLPLEPLVTGIREQIKFLKRTIEKKENMVFGPRTVAKTDYILGLRKLSDQLKSKKDYYFIRENFDFYEVYGNKDWGEVFLTSYFEPVIEGSLKKSERFSAPLLKKPRDLVQILVEDFDDRFKEIRTMRGRLLKERSDYGSLQVAPVPNRKEIAEGALDDEKLVICWVDPIDGFFLQVQGSGTVVLENKKRIRLGYAEQNGHPYFPIGKLFLDEIPLEEMTLHRLESHLRTFPEDKIQEFLFENPSYVFFQKIKGRPKTNIASPVVAGRTIAADTKFLPKGAVAFLTFKAPVFDSRSAVEPSDWKEISRFVLDQDTGGAIRGPGRADLFWGSGMNAKQSAGVIKQEDATLYYLVPKEEALNRWKQK